MDNGNDRDDENNNDGNADAVAVVVVVVVVVVSSRGIRMVREALQSRFCCQEECMSSPSASMQSLQL